MVFNKDLFLVRYSSISIYVTFFYFLEDQDITNYAVDTKIYTAKDKKESFISTLEISPLLLF